MTTRATGTDIVIRRLWTGDRAAVEAHFLRLDPETRRNRFMGALGDGAVVAYARRAVRTDGLMYGAFVGGELRGVAELRPASGRSRGFATALGEEAEAAFAIERDHRRAGLGTALFRRLARAARNRAVRRLRVRCLPENRAMLALARKIGGELVLEGCETRGELRLRDPTMLSLWREGIEDGLDLTLAATQRARPDGRSARF